MAKVNLLDTLPKTVRPVAERSQVSAEDRLLSWKLDKEYFDGTRQQGLGGYYYDGRWKSVVKRFKEYYELNSESKVLDVGCAKGFLIHDFLEEIPGITVAGIDISEYALSNATDKAKPHICMANAKELPFPDKYFDLVISINSLHNILELEEVKNALREIERVSRRHKYISIGAYSNGEEKNKLDKWAVVATTYLHCDEWEKMFREVGYTGDYWWFKP
ncbi:MAG TPA: ubiquinone/menaquinone biosynthesis protein [Elusimicrobia bacterium]|nr:ubiquinone/menaquinone biosynthesis protein [Elusimicrobiota bacterium]